MTGTGKEGAPWPSEIRVRDAGKQLSITFDNGEAYDYAAEYLRVESPSAEVKGHGRGQEVTVAGKRNVVITAIEPVGNYAIRITFDDMHSSGIFSWSYLVKLAQEQTSIWAAYLEKLEREGLTRG